MGSSVFPIPASGASVGDITTAGNSAGWGATAGSVAWTQLSNITASGAAVNFTGLGSYKYYRLVGLGITSSASAAHRLRINNNSSSSYYVSGISWNTNTMGSAAATQQAGWSITEYNTAAMIPSCFDVVVENLSASSGIKVMSGSFAKWYSGWTSGDSVKCFVVETGITQINYITQAGAFDAGTLTLFGGN
jgi:hypothetical protein